MAIDFDEPNGLAWVLMVGIVAIAILFIVVFMTTSTERTTRMALEAGCSQTLLPGKTEVVWGNCTKGLPPKE